MNAFKVGELAQRTGLTIRTLHHYDEIGLLTPSQHTESGHRLYSAADIARLQQIVSLRQLGFSLEEIKDCLDRPEFSPLAVVRMHTARLRQTIELERALCERLEGLARFFESAGEVSAERFLDTIEAMTMIEQYYTPEQLEQLRKRAEAPGGKELAEQGQRDWANLFAQLTALMNAGTDPADPKVQALVKRQHELVRAFTGGDPGIAASLKKMWTEQGDQLTAKFGYDPKVMEYLAKANAAAKK
jgi:MerR family transcriptional regulator, thiopeptide resistance regulator